MKDEIKGRAGDAGMDDTGDQTRDAAGDDAAESGGGDGAIRARDIVVFKGRRDGIAVLLDERADMADIKKTLRNKSADARKFFGGAKTAVYFQGRSLTENEENELMDILSGEGSLDITFVTNFNVVGGGAAKAAKALKQAAHGVRRPQSGAAAKLEPQSVIFHRGSLRSGQAVSYEGSVVIVGDVNPGAEVVAGGNIIVLGSAMGVVHAGSMGDSRAFVSAIRLMPTQLRIADVITIIPKEAVKNKEDLTPAYAYIENGQIYIEPLD